VPEPFPDGLISGLNVALNEAEWHNARVRADTSEAMLDFRVLALPEVGPEPSEDDRVLRLRLSYVGRVAASLRNGRWDDDSAETVAFDLDDLNDVVHGFGVLPIYGWEFFDPPESGWNRWKDRLSVDEYFSDGSEAHVLELFQEGNDRHLDLRIWFNGLSGYSLNNEPLALPDVVASGKRWWDALFAGDERVRGHGIVPGKKASDP
jgi:hypothetical protein